MLVQFCHGSPGFVLCLESIQKYFPRLQGKIDRAVTLARKDTWERGLLTKEPSLCHSIPENALALDDDDQFNYFLSWMTEEPMEAKGWMVNAGRSDIFAGLYGGEAGRAWVWAVADKKLSRTCIGFNDLRGRDRIAQDSPEEREGENPGIRFGG